MDLPFRSHFSLKTALHGLVGASVICVIIALFIAFTGPSSLRKAEDTLASQKIVLSGSENTAHHAETTDSHHADAESVAKASDSHAAETVHREEKSPSDHSEEHEGNNSPEMETHAAPAGGEIHAKDPLLPAPLDGLSEPAHDGHGVFPKTNSRGLTPFHGYKRPFNKTDKPVIALAVRNFGISRMQSIKLLRSLPRDVSFVVSPYATHINKWTKDARAAGHETWLYIPTQNSDYPARDPGPLALLKGSGLKESIAAMDHSLSQFVGYTGIAMDMDRTFLSSQTVLKSVLANTLQRGLGYFEMNSDAPPFFQSIVKANNAPYVQNDAGGWENLFTNIEARAKTKGHSVAVISLDDINIEDFIAWVNGLKDKGFALAPISAVADGRVQ